VSGSDAPGGPGAATAGGRRPVAVVAFGGNALLAPGDVGTVEEQKRRAEEAARWLTALVEGGRELAVVYGNGPQVGQVLIQMAAAATKIPPGTLDVAVAQTQGSIGYLLETALRNRLAAVGLGAREVAIVLSLVVVDRDDPGFERPSKPVGPFFSRYRAELLAREQGWKMVHDAGRGWRKVVPSPRPLEVLGVPVVRALLARGDLVIAGGGGGIPVVRRADGSPGGGALEGIEAVIDKDRTAALLARELGADLLINLTGVPEVRRGFGTAEERPLPRLTVEEARRLLAAGEFPAGSMGPKIESAVEFVEATGNRVLITDIDTLPAALAGDGGTVIEAGEAA